MVDTPHGDRLRLRFVTRADGPLLQALFDYEAGGFNDFGLVRAVRDDGWTDDELRTEDRGTFFVVRLGDGAALGTVSYHRVGYGPNAESRCWNIGIELKPEARGQGYGTEAQRLLADWLFATTQAYRVEASTDVENHREARSLEKAGFRRDGILRGAQFRAGAYHDLIVYARLRTDPASRG